MTQQLSTLYPEKDVKGKAFLVKATGRALTAVKNRTLILDTLALIFNATQHSGMYSAANFCFNKGLCMI